MHQNIDLCLFPVLHRDHNLVRQTYNRLILLTDPAVVHADLVRARRIRHAHIAVLHFERVIVSI